MNHAVLQEAFHHLCDVLNPFKGDGDCLDPNAVDWWAILSVADRTHVIPELFQAIIRHDIAGRIPVQVFCLLKGFDELNATRCRLLCQQSMELNAHMNGHGITPIWLKGAALFFEDNWHSRARLMNDLDVWIPEAHRQTLPLLYDLGYEAKDDHSNWADSHHYAPLMHKKRLAALELHKHVIRPSLHLLLPDQTCMARIQWQSNHRGDYGLLALEDRIAQSFVQCTEMACPPMESGMVRLMKVIDLLRMMARNNSQRLPEAFVATLNQEPFHTKASQFMTFLERDFSIPNPFQYDDGYCQSIDGMIGHPELEKSFNRRESLRPPVKWTNVFKNPKKIPEKLAKRANRFIEGSWQ